MCAMNFVPSFDLSKVEDDIYGREIWMAYGMKTHSRLFGSSPAWRMEPPRRPILTIMLWDIIVLDKAL